MNEERYRDENGQMFGLLVQLAGDQASTSAQVAAALRSLQDSLEREATADRREREEHRGALDDMAEQIGELASVLERLVKAKEEIVKQQAQQLERLDKAEERRFLDKQDKRKFSLEALKLYGPWLFGSGGILLAIITIFGKIIYHALFGQ